LLLSAAVACSEENDENLEIEPEARAGDVSQATPEIGGPSTPEAGEDIQRLHDEAPVVVPGIKDGTDWFTTIKDIEYDEAEGTLLALDRGVGHVIEFTPSGDFVRRFGGRVGDGPAELNRVVSFAFSDSSLFLLDRGNTKVLVYDRKGDYRDNFPVDGSHRSMAFSAGSLYLLPGSNGNAIDVYSSTGERVGGVGAASTLPTGDQNSGASTRLERAVCTGCQLLALPDGSLIAVGTEDGILVHYASTGEVRRRSDLLDEDPLLAGWRAADASRTQRAQQRAQAQSSSDERVEVFKTYLNGFSVDSEGRLLAAVIPSAERLERQGFEYWIIEPDEMSYRRFAYPRANVGFYATGSTREVFALDTEDGGIYRFRLPAEE
jgi:hypothetical protein